MNKLFVTIGAFIFGLTDVSSMEAYPYASFDFPQNGKLTGEMQSYFDKNGFIILKNYLNSDECQDLVTEGQNLISDFLKTSQEVVKLGSTIQNSHQEKFVEDSMDKIKFFFESNAFQKDELIVGKSEAVMKIGNALGDLNPKFRAVTFRDPLVNISETLGTIDPRVCHSMLMLKGRKVGLEVLPHQDATVLYTNPCTTLGFWIPLHDATVKNGCLRVIPGSHLGPLYNRSVKINDEVKTQSENPLSKNLDKIWTDEKFIDLVMNRGDMLVFSGKLVHGSKKNSSDLPRNAYAFHVIGANSDYPKNNWLHRDEFPRLKGGD